MRFIERLAEKNRTPGQYPVTAVFLGDSVTQGCFEIYQVGDGSIQCVCDYKSVYHNRLRDRLSVMFPHAPVNIINAGISGDSASNALQRMDRDVLRYYPDLIVVSFGLNDAAGSGIEGIGEFKSSLSNIFKKTQNTGAEVIFMSENMMCTYVDSDVTMSPYTAMAEKMAEIQNNGILDRYFEAAEAVSADHKVTFCDCYQVWKKLSQYHADITQLLANKLNHPIREMHTVFSDKLINQLLG